MAFNASQFWAAVKAVLSHKQGILAASQSMENTMQVIFSLIQSVLSAYETVKFGTDSRTIKDEDACAILEEYGKVQ